MLPGGLVNKQIQLLIIDSPAQKNKWNKCTSSNSKTPINLLTYENLTTRQRMGFRNKLLYSTKNNRLLTYESQQDYINLAVQ